MKPEIDFSHPVFSSEAARCIQPGDLHDFYCSASDFDKSNLYFMLLASSLHYEEAGDTFLAAHLHYLMACYLFISLTPPGSETLALHHIRKALRLSPCEEYELWLGLIQKGN